jgi:hypothetical protein
LARNSSDKFDKGDLKDDLKRAGFEDCVVDNIADRVNNRKADGWTYGTGLQEARRELETFIDSTKSAYNNFNQENTSATNRETMTTRAY